MRWIEPVDVNISEALLDVAGGRTLVAQTLARRGITDPQLAAAFLDPDRYISTPPWELPGMLAASSCVAEAIRTGLHIGVWGDFDVDGQTSTTLLVSALRGLGARVSYHIPVRAQESHGVNVPGLKHLFGQGVEFLITCDTGIDAHEAVEYAHSQNVPVIITDHHDLPAELPQAEAILNSKLVDESHPLGTLPGVGVAYKLVEALYEEVGRTAELESFLDLVALGIVADVALLQGDARYLLQRGLNVLRNTQRVGLQALMEYAQVVPAQVGTTDIGFSIAPRLNALGRLGDANGAVEFLSTTDRVRAQLFARSLESMNAQRRLLTEQVFQGAMAQIERDPGLLEFAALVLAQRGWPAGVVGIVASRLVERYNKPVILMTVPEDEPARGSARSIEGCNITAAIAEQADLLLGFGGHPMAAGLAIEQKHIETFRKRLSEAVAGQLGAVALEPQITIDAFVDLASLSLEMVADIDRLAPFGAGNPALVYAASDLRLERVEAVGRSGEHVRLVVEDTNGQQQSVVWWRGAGWDMPSGRFDLAFTAAKNTFRGKTKLQLEFRDFRIIEEFQPEIATLTRKIVDWRGEDRKSVV